MARTAYENGTDTEAVRNVLQVLLREAVLLQRTETDNLPATTT